MRVSHTTSQYPESFPSGRRCSTRNAVYVMYRGFESLTLRQNEKQVVRPAFCFGKTKRGIRTRREQTWSAEENSPVDCFCRRGQEAKLREGAQECTEKIPNSPPKKRAGHQTCSLFSSPQPSKLSITNAYRIQGFAVIELRTALHYEDF